MPSNEHRASQEYAIGLDVGGTKIAGGVVTRGGKILESVSIPMPLGETEPSLQVLALEVIGRLERHYPLIRAIGVGAAGMVDWPSGRIRWAPNNSYRNLPLKEILSDETGCTTVVDNDANVAAWAEARVGAGQGVSHLAVITVGTGIGAGLVLEGKLFRGATGIGGEIGHIIVNPDGPKCGCGSTGCLEALASGTALGRAGRKAAFADTGGMLARLAGAPERVTGETVFEAARLGDPTARSIFDDVGYWLGIGIASLVTLLDIQLVIIGGGLSSTGELLLAPTRLSFERFVFSPSHRKLPPIIPARMGKEAGMVGAAILALEATEPAAGCES